MRELSPAAECTAAATFAGTALRSDTIDTGSLLITFATIACTVGPVNGTTIAAGQGGGSRYIGAEADFWASYKPLDFLSINGGYSVFVPGSAASAMGHDDTQHWFWLQVDVFTP